MADPTKMVTDRRKSSLIVENSVGTSGETVAAKLIERTVATAGEGPVPDYLLVLQALGAKLAQTREELTAADQRHRDEVSDDDEHREKRDEAARELNRQILKLRDSFTGIYGATARKTLGFDDRTARDPMPLLAQGQRLLDNLRHPGLQLPAPQTPGIEVDLALILPPLETAVETLRVAIQDVAREKTEADLTLVSKNEALAAFDDTFLWVARALAALYSLAGEYELAARVRPSRRRPGRTETVDDQPEPGTSDEAQEEP